MTVWELIEKLNKVEDQTRIVVISRDPEGNGFVPVSEFMELDNACFQDEHVFLQELTEELEDLGFNEEDVREGEACIVLSPSY